MDGEERKKREIQMCVQHSMCVCLFVCVCANAGGAPFFFLFQSAIGNYANVTKE